MKARLLFRIELPYDRTIYKPLKDAGGWYFYDKEKKLYVWTFPLSSLPQVLAALGRKIEFDEQEASLALKYCPPLAEKVSVPPWKGEGFIDIYEGPDVFTILTVVGKEPQTYTIPKENVKAAWEVIRKYPLNKPVKSRTVAEHICRLLNLTRFFRQTGTFDWQKFFGARRDYYHYFYLPVKVLEHYYGAVKHHRKGAVERLTDTLPTKFIKQ